MNKKSFKIQCIVVPAVAMLALTGCASATSRELTDMLASGEQIEIELVLPEGSSVLADSPEEWTRLAALTGQSEIREVMDQQLEIFGFGNNSKNGVMYVDPETEYWQPDNTLENVFKNKAFLEYWSDVEKQDAIQAKVKESYTDLDDSTGADVLKLAALNAYFNLFADSADGAYNGDNVLTREQFMEGFAKAHFNTEAAKVANTVDALGGDEKTIYADLFSDASYLDLKSGSLNQDNYNAPITRAEAIYMIVNELYSDELSDADVKTNYGDVKDGGNIASEAGTDGQKYYRSANLKFMLENPSKGMDTELCKALAVAYKHGIAGNEQTSRWNETLTKNEAMNMLLAAFNDKGTLVNCKQGEYNEEAVAKEDYEPSASDFENAQAYELYQAYGRMPLVSYAEYYETACAKAEELGWDVDFTTWIAKDHDGYCEGSLIDHWFNNLASYESEVEVLKFEDTYEKQKEYLLEHMDDWMDTCIKVEKLYAMGVENPVTFLDENWYDVAVAEHEASSKPKSTSKPKAENTGTSNSDNTVNNNDNSTVSDGGAAYAADDTDPGYVYHSEYEATMEGPFEQSGPNVYGSLTSN